MVEHFPGMYKTLGFIPGTANTQKITLEGVPYKMYLFLCVSENINLNKKLVVSQVSW